MDSHIFIPELNQIQIHQEPIFCEDFVPDIELINLLIEELPDIDHETSGKDAFHDDTPLVKLEEGETYYAGETNYIPKQSETIRKHHIIKEKSSIQTSTLCPVCNDGNAGRHKHYGGKACASCRAFFRRAVENDGYRKFDCAQSNKTNFECEIDSKSWGSCRYCRFQKCLSAGLKTSLVLNQRQRQMRQKTRHKKKSQVFKKDNVENITMANDTLSTSSFDQEEVMLISFRIKQFMFEYLSKQMAHFFTKDPSSWDTVLKFSFENNPKADMIDVHNKKKFGRFWQTVFGQFLWESCDEHKRINPRSLDILFVNNMSTTYFITSVMSIGNSIVPSPLKELIEDVYERKLYLSTYFPHTPTHQQELHLEINQHDSHENYKNCITILAMRSMKNKIEMRPKASPLRFEQVYPSQNVADDKQSLLDTLKKSVFDVASWPTIKSKRSINDEAKVERTDKQSNPDMNVDYVLLHLLQIVLFYSTDNISKDLIDSIKAERLQRQYLCILHKYLKFHYPQIASSQLAKGISTMSKAREAGQLLQLCISWLSPH